MKTEVAVDKEAAKRLFEVTRELSLLAFQALSTLRICHELDALRSALHHLFGDTMGVASALLWKFPMMAGPTNADDEEQAKRDADAVVASMEMRRRLSSKDPGV